MAQMLKVEIDGKQVEVPHGTMLMEAANKLGLYVPHFCYHKKLSIAANCRMCLVEVEKAPKPLPACATPVTDGMKAWTHSSKAKQAQAGVMEFLLINHPLDCPICDQGGECQLQDLAVGYGGSSSRYDEPKRVIIPKDVGPLVAMEEMTRCIHCTRCVRFGQEVAGTMELGMMGRGEHSEIVSFVGKTVDSELSGNMIDVCPVGALTSKPFRYAARTWELTRRKSVSPHDALGSNLVVQLKLNRVMRVLPLENEAVNECWLSDRDRFSYEALHSEDRLLKPMVKGAGGWQEVDWQVALERVVAGLRDVAQKSGGAQIGVLASPQSTLEELFLAQKLARALGSENVDFRLRQVDTRADGKRAGAPWLGMQITDLPKLDRVLVVGSFLRKDHPLLVNRFRQAAKRGQQVSLVTIAGDDPLVALTGKLVVAPSALVDALAQVVKATAEAKGAAVPASVAGTTVGAVAKSVAASLASGKDVGVFLGNVAEQHPRAAELQVLANELATIVGGRVGILGADANSVGGYLAGAVPGPNGLGAAAMMAAPRKAYVVLGAEPELDMANPRAATAALGAAEFVVAMTQFRTEAIGWADVILPIAPFTETSGTFVNTEGRMQSFNGVAKPLGDARPAWKVLRVLGTMLGAPGFEFDTSEAVRDAVTTPDAVGAKLSNRLDGVAVTLAPPAAPGLERVTDVPIYFTDPIVRRAHALQHTTDAQPPRLAAASATLARLGLAAGDTARVKQGGGEAVLPVAVDDTLPASCVRIPAGHPSTAGLAGMFGEVTVERA
jgi:NADH-quinone oxidoreductase subunit G